MALQERAGEKLELLCVDENPECLELARAKATATNEQHQFRYSASSIDSTSTDNQFRPGDRQCLARLTQRVPKDVFGDGQSGGARRNVALALPTVSSFGEFFSIYWEALHNCGLLDHESDVEQLITGCRRFPMSSRWRKTKD